MGRRFTAASSERITVENAADLAGFSFLFGTFACVLYRSQDTGAFETMGAFNNDASASHQYGISSGDLLFLYDNPQTRTMTGAVSASQYWLLAITKATGTATGVGHRYQFSTATWTHANLSGTAADSGATTIFTIGSLSPTGADLLSSEIVALGFWPGLVMTNSECERLARGRWLELNPRFYVEWGAPREVAEMARSLGQNRVRQTTMVGTTRGVQPPPPGFRMSPQARRR